MTANSPACTWQELNQRALSAALDVVKAEFALHRARVTDGEPRESSRALEAAQRRYADLAAATLPEPSLEALRKAFGLSSFERSVLLMCAGMELDGSFAASCRGTRTGNEDPLPTFGLALAALPRPHWSALTPDAPLRRWRLIDFATSGGLAAAPVTTRPLCIDERVLHYLAGLQHLDERLSGPVQPVMPESELMPTHLAVADRAARVWSRAEESRVPVVCFYGADFAAARAIAAHVCALLGMRLHRISASAIPSGPADLRLFIRLWEREAVLSESALLVECGDDPASGAACEFLERAQCALMVTSRERRSPERDSEGFEIKRPPTREQRAVWTSALNGQSTGLESGLDLLISQFDLSVPAIRSAARQAVAVEQASRFDALWDACREHARTRLDDLAQRIETALAWDDLVLPEAQKETLRDIVRHVRHRTKVHDTWGFASKGSRGLGISALFAGSSGTGKTMAAEVLARELRLDLYRIDLSSVVSKYIGETEKNLRRVFDAAEAGGAILLFDEADVLFGKRSEVKDSHDRYANIEVGYLLQRMECYWGLAILTTNMKNSLDPAFLRRIRFIVHFPFPDAQQRAEIWRRTFASGVPVTGLRFNALAQLSIAGGNIRSIALNSAYLAASQDEAVSMPHILHAARAEYAKLEKPLTDAEVAGWV
jgi:AAA+ superfamily predicted ATPase